MKTPFRFGKKITPNPIPLEPIGPYHIKKCLGRGGQGEVYQAHDQQRDRRVAIKFIHTWHLKEQGNLERFRHEARALTQFEHPFVVRFHDLIQWRGRDGIVLEFVEGPTLEQRLGDGRLNGPEALPLLREITQGLAYIHGKNLLHRDLKATNIKLTPGGHAKILDFSLAVKWTGFGEERLTLDGHLVGTPEYMSPEQILGEPLDSRSDLFSLGVLFYHALTAHPPFRARSAPLTWDRVCHGRQQPLSEWNPCIPPGLSDLIDQMLEKNRDKRPGSARDVDLALASMTDEVAKADAAQSGKTMKLPPPMRYQGNIDRLISLHEL